MELKLYRDGLNIVNIHPKLVIYTPTRRVNVMVNTVLQM